MLKKLLRSEVLLGLSALVVSICALVVTIRQTTIAQQQLNGSVWPNLLIGDSRPNLQTYYLAIANQGIGPAIIRQMTVIHQGIPYDQPIRLATQQRLSPSYASMFSGRVIKPGEELKLIICEQDSTLARKLQHLFDRDQTNFRLIYSHVYGNCWQSDGLRYKALANRPPATEMDLK